MVNRAPKMHRLFKPKVSKFPSYSEFINLLTLYDNKFSNNLLSHFQCDEMRVAIYVLRDHLSYLNESRYTKLTDNLEEVQHVIQEAFQKCTKKEDRCLIEYLGIQGNSVTSQVEIGKHIGASKSEVGRRIRKFSQTLLEDINKAMFPDITLPKVQPNISGTTDRPTLYISNKAEPNYSEVIEYMANYESSFRRSALQLIENKGLRAAVGSFKSCEDEFTAEAYESLVENKLELSEIIVNFVCNNFTLIDCSSYLAYWQLADFAGTDMSPEDIAKFCNTAVTTVRNHIAHVGQSVNTYLKETIIKKPYDSAYVCRPIDINTERTLLYNMAQILQIEERLSCSVDSTILCKLLGGLFTIASTETAVTARVLLNAGSIQDAKDELSRYGFHTEGLSKAACNSRKTRFTKALKTKFTGYSLKQLEKFLHEEMR